MGTMTKARKGIRAGQIPEWRPGAVYWKPLADGREVTIYPLRSYKARLCVGPLADPHGYDIAYLYDTQSAAIDAAEMWDGENMERPPGYARIEFQHKQHMGKSPLHSRAVQPGAVLEVTDSLRDHFEVIERQETGSSAYFYEISGITEDGMAIIIRSSRQRGDGMGNNGFPLVRVETVDIQEAPNCGRKGEHEEC